ncbi:class I adenylate-forming enzyme family protein [Treponema pallidum]|nr:class I adenylate-forming enzyme family protein [Treponema pallidum]
MHSVYCVYARTMWFFRSSPLHTYSSSCVRFLQFFLQGACVWYAPPLPQMRLPLQQLQCVKPTLLFCLPPFLEASEQLRSRRPCARQLHTQLGGQLRLLVLWSEECSEHTQILHRISLEAVLFHGYLHASVLIFVTAKKNTKDKDMPAPRTQTRAVPGLKTRLLNYNAFTSTGELALRGEGVTPGYWRDEVRTRAAFTPDGWLRTGTLWTKTETGNLLPCSSSCHMQLGARGEAVYAEDLVCVLMQHPCVVHAHVRVDTQGQAHCAVWVKQGAERIRHPQIVCFLRTQLSTQVRVGTLRVMEYEKTVGADRLSRRDTPFLKENSL